MTIIIGAHLDDGRKVMLSDGKLSAGGSVAEYDCKKIELIHSINRTRPKRAIIGSAGTGAAIIVFRNAVQHYLSSPVPQVEDLFFRLTGNESPLEKNDAEHLAWLPDPANPQGDHVLVEVDGAHWPRVVRQSFWAIGSGGCEARATLLGSVYQVNQTFDSAWRPSEKDVWAAYYVACHVDLYCGGTPQLLIL